ncbi:hypothetical protein DES52_110156 [Deinococcus yavapaiensis KR-236]|uniref:Uncharacterized protein n=1 Tax=Deinococcus yavapaiensis KR-236 TaxID=694435 RepID=A0A318S6B9_9DEIO|nr:hypothetical protein DES52_110156 [Deinococcus yavapaiensis KR-236]
MRGSRTALITGCAYVVFPLPFTSRSLRSEITVHAVTLAQEGLQGHLMRGVSVSVVS